MHVNVHPHKIMWWNYKKSHMWQTQPLKLFNNLKKLFSFRHYLVFILDCGPFISYWEKKKSFAFIPLKWKQTLSFCLSPLWQVNLCLVEDERTGLFNRENRTVSPSLLPLSSVLYRHTTTQSLNGWGSLWLYCTEKKKSWVVIFKTFKHIVPAASGHGQWLILLLHWVCSGVWPARGRY